MVPKDFSTILLLVCCVSGGQMNNVARLKPTQASSKYRNMPPSQANDGNYNADWGGSSCFATDFPDLDPWWMVDLQKIYKIKGFMVLSRLDCCPDRLSNFTVETFVENPVNFPEAVASHCYFYAGNPAPGTPEVRDCNKLAVGQYFRLQMHPTGSETVMSMCEVEVYTTSTECSRYSGTMNARMSHTSSLAANTAVECAEACIDLLSCLGFNFKEGEVPECQIVTIISGQPVTPEGWNFYQYQEC